MEILKNFTNISAGISQRVCSLKFLWSKDFFWNWKYDCHSSKNKDNLTAWGQAEHIAQNIVLKSNMCNFMKKHQQ